jgi:hypothetical protein
MPPMNLKTIARDANRRGDTKRQFHALDLLELMPITGGGLDAFMDFCTELEESRLYGARAQPALRAVS